MANKIQDLYGKDVIDALTAAMDETSIKEDMDEKKSNLKNVTVLQLEQTESSKLFSELFWKPKSIPDLPVPVFKDEEWAEQARVYIPEADPNWIWNKPATEGLVLALVEGDTTLLTGMPGTGKTCLAEQLCALLRIPFWRMSCNPETREQHFLGPPSLDYDEQGNMRIKQEATVLTDSLRYGGMFCEDEAFRHSAALVLQSLREKNSRYIILPDAPGLTASERKLKAPKNRWWYVLTDNTNGTGDETGSFNAEVQDSSTLDRIDSCIEVGYLPLPAERKLLSNLTKFNEEQVNAMLNVAKGIRKEFSKQGLLTTMSVRGLMAWARKAEITGSFGTGFKLSWLNKACSQDQVVAKDLFTQVFGESINDI